MGLIILGGVGVVGLYFYMNSHAAGPASAPSTNPLATFFARSSGPVPGTVPPGAQLPSMGASGLGPNTTGAVVGTAGAFGTGLASIASRPSGQDDGSSKTASIAALGIGAVIGVGMALWAAHEARVKGAKDENAALNIMVPDFQNALLAEFDALNKGQVSPTTALNDLEMIRASYWQRIAPFQQGPGQHTHPCAPLAQTDVLNTGEYAPGFIPWVSATKQTTPCNSSCTAGCCIGCDSVEPTIGAAKWLIAKGGGSIKIHAIGGSKYGYTGTPAYMLTYAPGQA